MRAEPIAVRLVESAEVGHSPEMMFFLQRIAGFHKKLGRCNRPSKLPMDSRPENRYGTSGAVECRVGHELVIQRELGRFLKLKIVIGFQGFFRAVAQRAVAVEYAQAAGLQEFLVGRAKCRS